MATMCGATYTSIAVYPSQNAPYAVRNAAAKVAPVASAKNPATSWTIPP